MGRKSLSGSVVIRQGVTNLNREDRFTVDTMKRFFTVSLRRPWDRFRREAVAAPSLEVFKARLDRALSNLV